MSIRLLRVGKTPVYADPLIFLFIAVGIVFDMAFSLIVMFISLSLHEFCHAIAAKSLGVEVTAVEIQPFGFVARIKSSGLSCTEELAIALAGPLFSVIAASTATMFCDFSGSYIVEAFATVNFTICAINLLPAVPLDGGRILSAILKRFVSPRTVSVISLWLGLIVSALLLVIGVAFIAYGYINLTPGIMGLFLLLATLREYKLSRSVQASAILTRFVSLHKGEAIVLRQLALHESVTAKDALSALSMNRYNIIVVVNDEMTRMGEIDEGKLLIGAAKHGNDVKLSDLL